MTNGRKTRQNSIDAPRNPTVAYDEWMPFGSKVFLYRVDSFFFQTEKQTVTNIAYQNGTIYPMYILTGMFVIIQKLNSEYNVAMKETL